MSARKIFYNVCVANLDDSHERNVMHAVAYRMVVSGGLLSDFGHRLANAFAESHAHLHASRAHATDLDAAVQLASEIEQYRSRLAVVFHRASAVRPPALLGNLPVARLQQALGVFHHRPVPSSPFPVPRILPHHPCNRHKRARARIGTARLQREKPEGR